MEGKASSEVFSGGEGARRLPSRRSYSHDAEATRDSTVFRSLVLRTAGLRASNALDDAQLVVVFLAGVRMEIRNESLQELPDLVFRTTGIRGLRERFDAPVRPVCQQTIARAEDLRVIRGQNVFGVEEHLF